MYLSYQLLTIKNVISPIDIVFSNQKSMIISGIVVTAVPQHVNCVYTTGTGYGLHGRLNNKKKLWYVSQDAATTIYSSKIDASSDTFVWAITCTNFNNIWHHRLCHTGNFVTDKIDKVVNGVPCLRSRNPFFSCNDCSCGKTTAQIKGYNKDLTRATIPGQSFFTNYEFVCGKETTKQEDGPLLTSKDGFNC